MEESEVEGERRERVGRRYNVSIATHLSLSGPPATSLNCSTLRLLSHLGCSVIHPYSLTLTPSHTHSRAQHIDFSVMQECY